MVPREARPGVSLAAQPITRVGNRAGHYVRGVRSAALAGVTDRADLHRGAGAVRDGQGGGARPGEGDRLRLVRRGHQQPRDADAGPARLVERVVDAERRRRAVLEDGRVGVLTGPLRRQGARVGLQVDARVPGDRAVPAPAVLQSYGDGAVGVAVDGAVLRRDLQLVGAAPGDLAGRARAGPGGRTLPAGPFPPLRFAEPPEPGTPPEGDADDPVDAGDGLLGPLPSTSLWQAVSERPAVTARAAKVSL